MVNGEAFEYAISEIQAEEEYPSQSEQQAICHLLFNETDTVIDMYTCQRNAHFLLI